MKKTLLILILNIFLINKSFALIEIDITRGNLDPLPVAVSPLHVDIKSENFEGIKIKELGEDISKIVEDNFRSTGLFNPLKKEAFVQKPDIAHLKPRFEDWRLIKAQALVTGKLLITDGKLKVEFRLWDLAAAKEMTALAFTTTPSNWRRVAHIISDKIYERLTGEEGYFDTRIIYVAESGPKEQRVKKLAIMDQDGANTKYLTLGNELVLTPFPWNDFCTKVFTRWKKNCDEFCKRW
jgi:TolB protein